MIGRILVGGAGLAVACGLAGPAAAFACTTTPVAPVVNAPVSVDAHDVVHHVATVDHTDAVHGLLADVL